MDSRIREIEQRLVRAKEGLSEGGREDYLQQLYLLDAEIRAVIKENGILPKSFSQPKANMTRRFLSPALGFGMSVGAILLAATSTYAAFLLTSDAAQPANLASHNTVATAPVMDEIKASLPEPDADMVEPQIATEEAEAMDIVPAPVQLLLAQNPLTASDDSVTVPGQISGAELAVSPAQAKITPEVEEGLMAGVIPPMVDTPVFNSDGAVSRMVSSSNTDGVEAAQPVEQSAGFDWRIARFALPGKNKKAEAEEVEVVNVVKEKLSKSLESSE